MLLDLLYLLVLIVASPWILFRALTTGRYREGNGARLFGLVPKLPQHDGPTFWLHAVSVGEVNLLPLLVSRLEKACPQGRCVISTTTRTGMEVAQKRFGATHTVFYFPLDFTWAMRCALRRIQPSVILLAELEVWPNLVQLAQRQQIPVVIFNGRISDSSFKTYRRFRWLLASTFKRISFVISQSALCSQRFEQLGVPVDRIITPGSIKFDGARTDRHAEAVEKVRRLSGLNTSGARWLPVDEQTSIFLAGSTQDPEEEMALNSFLAVADAFPELRLILVPRHPERFNEVAAMLTRRGISFIRRTELRNEELSAENSDESATGLDAIEANSQKKRLLSSEQLNLSGKIVEREKPEGLNSPVRVLLVDAMGELSAWWGVADLAFVGGSMGTRGGQNMIEPSGYGAAVSFGPNTRNFRDIVAILLEAKAAIVVHDQKEMDEFIKKGMTDPFWRQDLGARAQAAVVSQAGAADKTVSQILQFLS